LLAQSSVSSSPREDGVRAIDIHAHYYPQAYFDLFNTEGQRYNAEFRMTEQGFFFKAPHESSGPLPAKFIDVKQRLADMDAQGVAVQALSLTGPMTYWSDGELAQKLAMAWNDGAVAAHQAHPDRFVVLATLPMLDPDRAVNELNRVSKLPGVRGTATVALGQYTATSGTLTIRCSSRFLRESNRSSFPSSCIHCRLTSAGNGCRLIRSETCWPIPWTRLSPHAI
jgi:hypothetical protein